MATMTLLEMTQDILRSLSSDSVNGIGDTPEAEQVAYIIRRTYFNLVRAHDWTWLKQLREMTAMGDSNRPTKMQVPDNMVSIEFLKYNVTLTADTKTKWRELKYMCPDDFIRLTEGRASDASNVVTEDTDNSVDILIYNDRMPTYYTSFDDKFVYFDSYDSDEDTTVQASKTKVYGIVEPTWTHEGTFTPTLPADMFSTLLEDARSTCMFEIKEKADPKTERNAARALNIARHTGNKTGGKHATQHIVNLGRRGK